MSNIVKMISWNINGAKSALSKGLIEFIRSMNPDIISFQETKSNISAELESQLNTYSSFWCDSEKKGYAGTAILTKMKPISHKYGLKIQEHDSEGRVITLEYPEFYLLNIYTPNSQRGLTRLDYRMKWDKDFLNYIKNLDKTKPLIMCGDLNVSHTEIDLANPKPNRRNAGFTDEERQNFTILLENGFVDTFRMFNKEPGNYTFWSNMNNARARNVGWRLDYFLVSTRLKDRIKSSTILKDIMGSDHCPIALEMVI